MEKSLITRYYYWLDSVKSIILNPLDHYADHPILKRLVQQTNQKNNRARKAIIKQHQSPLISIILPVLNSEKTIQIAIKSLQQQTYANWELIVIDDGSTDTTLEVINRLAQQDNRIKPYKNKQKKGVAYTRNIGLSHATGNYITFHDADDRSHPERLEYQLAELCTHPSLKVVTFLYCRETKKGEPLITNGKVKWNRVSGMMFGRDIFAKLGYFKQLHISEDSEYYERIKAVYGKQACKIIPKLLYYSLFDTSSLLFSNANVKIKGGRVLYKIKQSEYEILEQCRKIHKSFGVHNNEYYQSFKCNNER